MARAVLSDRVASELNFDSFWFDFSYVYVKMSQNNSYARIVCKIIYAL